MHKENSVKKIRDRKEKFYKIKTEKDMKFISLQNSSLKQTFLKYHLNYMYQTFLYFSKKFRKNNEFSNSFFINQKGVMMAFGYLGLIPTITEIPSFIKISNLFFREK